MDPTATDLAWLPWMLQTADALFPTGAYAHSFGFEQSVQLGSLRNGDDLLAFLKERTLPALRDFELPYLRFAYVAAAADDLPTLAGLDQEIAATKLPRETREASAQLGQRRLAALRILLPHDPLLGAFAERGLAGHHLVICALQAAAFGAPLPAALAAYYYQAVAAIGAAAMKLIRIGQEGVQRTLAEVNRESSWVVAASMRVQRDMAGWFDPLLEIASMRHERAAERLFIS